MLELSLQDRMTKNDRMTKGTEGQKETEGDLLCIHDFIMTES